MIALAVASVVVAISANSIMRRQAQIEEALAKPVINVEFSKSEDSETIGEVSIVNHGSAINNVKIEVTPYLNIRVNKIIGRENGYDEMKPNIYFFKSVKAGGKRLTSAYSPINIYCSAPAPEKAVISGCSGAPKTSRVRVYAAAPIFSR